jgi:uncharacterized membrane protein
VLAFYEAQSFLMLFIFTVLLVVKVWAMADALIRPAGAYVASGKLTKPAWVLILALALAVHLLDRSAIGILSLLGTVAAFVYLADARPALRLHRGTR